MESGRSVLQNTKKQKKKRIKKTSGKEEEIGDTIQNSIS